MPHSTKDVETVNAVLASDPPRMCRKHGSIGDKYVRFNYRDILVPNPGESIDYCGFCFHEMLEKFCEKAIPIPEPVKPYVGD